jgi:hypothetical protein
MSNTQVEAFEFWFSNKYNAEKIGEDQLAFTLEIDGEKVPTFIFFFEGMWSVICPFMLLGKKSKSDLIKLINEHLDQSPFGITLLGDLLSITNCSTNFNAADADEFINEFARHAVMLMRPAGN